MGSARKQDSLSSLARCSPALQEDGVSKILYGSVRTTWLSLGKWITCRSDLLPCQAGPPDILATFHDLALPCLLARSKGHWDGGTAPWTLPRRTADPVKDLHEQKGKSHGVKALGFSSRLPQRCLRPCHCPTLTPWVHPRGPLQPQSGASVLKEPVSLYPRAFFGHKGCLSCIKNR